MSHAADKGDSLLGDAEALERTLLVRGEGDVLEHDQSRLCLCVYAVEDRNLRHLLLLVALINAVGVYPDGRTNTDRSSVDLDRLCHELREVVGAYDTAWSDDLTGVIAETDALEVVARPAVTDGDIRLTGVRHQLVWGARSCGCKDTQRPILELAMVFRTCAGLTSIGQTQMSTRLVEYLRSPGWSRITRTVVAG